MPPVGHTRLVKVGIQQRCSRSHQTCASPAQPCGRRARATDRRSRTGRATVATLPLQAWSSQTASDDDGWREPALVVARVSRRPRAETSFARISRPSAFRCEPEGGQRRQRRPFRALQVARSGGRGSRLGTKGGVTRGSSSGSARRWRRLPTPQSLVLLFLRDRVVVACDNASSSPVARGFDEVWGRETRFSVSVVS